MAKLKWDSQKIKEIRLMIDNGLTNKQIAEVYGVSRDSIVAVVRKKLSGNPNYRLQIQKYKHLYEPVMKYFLNHTWDETKKYFNLNDNNLKSIFSYAYKSPELKKYRKDTRRKDEWNLQELKTLLVSCGLIERKDIARMLKRGNGQGVKDKINQLSLKSRNVNGLTLTQYRELFGKEPKKLIKTKAGSGLMKIKLVPWVILEQDKNLNDMPDFIKTLISTMAIFQRWINEADNNKSVIKKINQIVKDNKQKETT